MSRGYCICASTVLLMLPTEPVDVRLNDISTQWSAVQRAHGKPASAAITARQNLLKQYQTAALRYLRGAIRDEDAVHDLFQEFVMRLLRGDFHRANPRRGRFRDYLKSALINLVNDYYRQSASQPRLLGTSAADRIAADASFRQQEESFLDCCRQDLLEKTWDALRRQYPQHHELLRLVAESPQLSARELADRMTSEQNESPQPTLIRKRLQRAREKFADLLLEQVVLCMQTTQLARVRQELADLRLLGLCRSALDRWLRAR